MGIFEKSELSPSLRVFWSGALLLAGQKTGLKEYGASRAAKAEKNGDDWTILLGGEVPPEVLEDRDTDAVFLAILEGDELTYQVIASDFSKWKREIRRTLKAAKLWSRSEANAKGWGIAIGVAAAAASVILVATGVGAPIAAATLAAGTTLAGAVASGGDAEDLLEAAEKGLADASAALEESDPEAAEVLTQAAAALDQATGGLEEPLEGELEPAPLTTIERARQLLEENPITAALGALAAALALRALIRG